jgi:two-component system OmpR family sensor kinase
MRRLVFLSRLPLPHLIRVRLTLWYTCLVALVLAVFVGTVFAAFSQYQQSADDYTQLLTQTFNQQVKVELPPAYFNGYGARGDGAYYKLQLKDPSAPAKSGYPMGFFDLSGKPLPNQPPNPLLDTGAAKKGQQTVATHGKTAVTQDSGWRYITVPLSFAGDSAIGQIAVPTSQLSSQITFLKRILVSVAAALLLISAAGGWLLARRALAPVDAITRRARQITERDLSQRFNLNQADELGRLAGAFDDMIGRLDAAFTRQQRFTSDASHELRTPITVMQAEVELMLARPRSVDEYQHTLGSMGEELNHLGAIVGKLLALTRIDVDPAGLAHEQVALDRLLGDVLGGIGVIAEERAVTLAIECLAPVMLTGDPTRLRQLFSNLLDNAVTYTPDGGCVSVALEETGVGARVRISDTGIGISSEHLSRIFERFYRTDAARAHNTGGTGLGLAIARAVAQAHHGDITVESAPGMGTTFTVELPCGERVPERRGWDLRRLVGAGSAAR